MEELKKLETVFKPRDVADRYGIAVTTVYELVKNGKLTGFRIGNRLLFRESDLVEFENVQSTGNG